ncbi:S41 family peptidase [Paraglaciecola aestuariivivens]
MTKSIYSTTALLLACSMLSACGGGGDSAPSFVRPAPTTPTNNAPTWTPGVFANASTFKNKCEVPRVGPDSNGDTFSDTQGTAMHEKMWLRSWNNDTYLWYSEVADNDPTNYSVANYFAQLKTDERTASGALKDNFHFSQSTEDYNKRTQSGLASGYGISWEFVSNTAPRKLIVRYTEPDSPANLAGVQRGYELKSIDGIDFVNTSSASDIDKINAAIFPDQPEQSFEFEFANAQGESVLQTTLTSANIEIQPVQNVSVLDTDAGTMGYMQFNTFIRTGQSGLIDGFQTFVDQGVTQLVLDLRYNGGGLLAMASQLAYMIAGSQTDGRNFETLQFNDKHPSVDPVTGRSIQPTPFYDQEINWTTGRFVEGSKLPSLDLTRVYILATQGTCSASEAVINGLRGIDVEVVLIGDRTCGKPYGFYATDNCSTTYFTIQFQGVNNKGFGDYADGFKPVDSPVFDDELPGCAIEDDFSQALGDSQEALFNAAVTYAEQGQCPVQNKPANKAPKQQSNTGLAIKDPNSQLEMMLLNNKIYTPLAEPKS